jgi:hypothetical protein
MSSENLKKGKYISQILKMHQLINMIHEINTKYKYIYFYYHSLFYIVH